MIIDHNDPIYRSRWRAIRNNRWNGAFYYSKEIVAHIIPRVDTDRSWVTVNCRKACDGAIVFIHNNLHPENYNWLRGFRDLVLVCGVPETCKKVEHLGRAVYLPLSVDVEYVEQFKRPKTRGTAYVGRKAKLKGLHLPDVDIVEGLPRTKLLPVMAQYERVYAVGRTAIEARVLGCEILPFDERYPDPSLWKVLDSREAAVMLQDML